MTPDHRLTRIRRDLTRLPHDQVKETSVKKCSAPGCERPHSCRGLCAHHYRRAMVTGELAPINDDRAQRFAESYVVNDDGCWVWTGATNGIGYGRLGGFTLAHRWSYENHRGPIPDGLDLDHLCRVTLCVNPWHLEPVTRAENARRQAAANATAYCPSGHLYDIPNTYIDPQGYRRCRACRRESMRGRGSRSA